MNDNELVSSLPVGPLVDPTPAALPGPVTFNGRFGSVARLNTARAAAPLWREIGGHEELWTYISGHGPFAGEGAFTAWLQERETQSDPCYYTVHGVNGRTLGLLALMHTRRRCASSKSAASSIAPHCSAPRSAPKRSTGWRAMHSKRSAIAAMNENAIRSTLRHTAPPCVTDLCLKAFSVST